MTSLSKVIIGGFKSIRDRVEVSIAPITFLFGPNSAGKSTLFDAIGECITRIEIRKDLGGFGNTRIPPVFEKGLNHIPEFSDGDSMQSRLVSLGVGISDFASHGPQYDSQLSIAQQSGRAIYWAIDGSQVDFEISESLDMDSLSSLNGIYELKIDSRTLLKTYDPWVAFDKQIISSATLDDSYDFKNSGLFPIGCMLIDIKHPLWKKIALQDTEVNLDRVAQNAVYSDDLRRLLNSNLCLIEKIVQTTNNHFLKKLVSLDGEYLKIRTIVNLLNVEKITAGNYSVLYENQSLSEFAESIYGKLSEDEIEEIEKVENLLNFICEAISFFGNSVLDIIPQNIVINSVSGNRNILGEDDTTSNQVMFPFYSFDSLSEDSIKKYSVWLGLKNIDMIPLFQSEQSKIKLQIDLVNEMLSSKIFGSRAYKVTPIVSKKTIEFLVSNNEDDLQEENVSYSFKILLEDENGRSLNFKDVGSGISYIFPVLTTLFINKFSWIAQPELHLHPAAQCEVGDLILRAFNDGHYSVIETHSEHILLRVLKRIRQSTNNDPKLLKNLWCPPEAVSVLYFDPKEDGSTTIKQLRVTRLGDFLDNWPNGFFEERSKELFDE